MLGSKLAEVRLKCAFSVTFVVFASLILDPKLARSAEIDQAIQILASALSCPLETEKICEDDCGITTRIRTITRQINRDDLAIFRMAVEKNVRTQLRGKPQIEDEKRIDEYVVRFSDLDLSEMQSEVWTKDMLGYWPEGEARLIIPCRGNEACVSVKEYDNRRDGSLKLRVCNLESAEIAKAALTVLTRASAALSSQRPTADKNRVGIFKSFENFDIRGKDARTIRNTDIVACQSSCSEDRSCMAFSFDKWNQYCFLKSNIDKLSLDPRSVSGVRSDVPGPELATTPFKMTRYRKKAFPGDGYRLLSQLRFEGCELECQAEKQCVAFTYQRARKNKECSLFAKTGEYNSSPDADSGIKTQAQ